MTMIPEQHDRFPTVDQIDYQETSEDISFIPSDLARKYRRNGRRKMLVKWNQTITWAFFALEIALAFRVLLKLIAANPLSPFTMFIYHLTRLFVAPFSGITATPDVSGSVLEISSIIGMIAYAVLYWLLIRLIWIIFNPTEPSDASRYEPDL